MYRQLLILGSCLTACLTAAAKHSCNSTTISNPILPGFHPDPSCIFVPEWDDTFFCASSSFNAFPGIPIHASKDLQTWKLIGHVLNRKDQLPALGETNRSTSGIWAPSIRYNNGTFWLVTTLVDDDRPQTDFSRWTNIIFKATDPYTASSWSNAVHFNFTGYDTSPFWDKDGKVYITGAHAWQVFPGIQQAEANLETGEVGEWTTIWNGTGGLAPEGPHIYYKDDYYYLLVAEGGTGLNHMVSIARSKSIHGPYEANPHNPVLTNANTTSYFQTVGHADIFPDSNGNYWCVALSTRSGPEYINYPMGRETVMTVVSWPKNEFPHFAPISGNINSWPLPKPRGGDIQGYIETTGDDVSFGPNSTLAQHLTYWRYPHPESYTISPPGHPNTLRLTPSFLNLTALNGNYAGPTGQTFIGRRQQDTLFTYSINLSFSPTSLNHEAGVSVFLTQNHHLDLGIVLLPATSATAPFPGRNLTTNGTNELIPMVRFRGISYIPVLEDVIVPLPQEWRSEKLRLEIKATNMTHYDFSVGPAGRMSDMRTVITVNNAAVSWGFTGTILGVYCTTNGGDVRNGTEAYVSEWKYVPQGQFRD